jgi:hypothetical protein
VRAGPFVLLAVAVFAERCVLFLDVFFSATAKHLLASSPFRSRRVRDRE